MDVFMLGCHAHTPSASILRHKVTEYRCLTVALWWDLGRWKLTKVSRDDSMAKTSVCRAKMDLTNVNMYTQQWLVTLDPHQVVVFNLGQLNSNHERAITHAHTWLSNYIMHLWELMPYEEICGSYTTTQVQEWSLGVNIVHPAWYYC